jgi:transposase
MSTPRRSYRTDLSDARWALIEPILSAWRAGRIGLGISPIQHELREIVNAILYVNRTGIPWEYLPHDFPPYKTVHGYFALWEKEGITEAIHDALRGKVRKAAGRSPEPTAAILDAQTVKTSGNVPEHSQGIDAGKRIKGRKRHVATDVLGLLLVVLVTAASVHDTVGGRALVNQVAGQHPTVAVAWVDSGYKQSVIDVGAIHGIDVQVVTKDPQQRGFVPQRKRWAVERTLCAARRSVVSPVQPGGTRREVPGSAG